MISPRSDTNPVDKRPRSSITTRCHGLCYPDFSFVARVRHRKRRSMVAVGLRQEAESDAGEQRAIVPIGT